MRQVLAAEGTLDRTLKPRRSGTTLLLPITAQREGAVRARFETNKAQQQLPRPELIGGIALLQEHDHAGAEAILASRPNIHTVLFATSDVAGEYRIRQFEVLAGRPVTRTEVIEHGCRFTIDLSAAYFSARLATERQRIAAMAGKGELVLDMFAGVGPFAIALRKKAALVLAADINPQAVALMLENISRNRAANVLPVLTDARHLAGIIPWQSDRIIMNLPKSGEEFLPHAFRLCRPGGTIHFYALVSRKGEYRERVAGLGGTITTERIVRSYSPAQWHAVYDIVVK